MREDKGYLDKDFNFHWKWGYGVWCLTSLSVMSWRSVLLVEESEVPGENLRPVASHWQTLSHNVVSSTPRQFELKAWVTGTDYHRKSMEI